MFIFLFRFLFQPPYNFEIMPEIRTAIEILAATRSWEIVDIRNRFQKQFLQEYLSQSNAKELYSLAHHFGENDICDACKDFTKDDLVLDRTTNKYGQKSCFIKIDSYNEPLDFLIPLTKALSGDRSSRFKDGLETDIANEITFEAKSGTYVIKGFEIALNVDSKCNDKNLPVLKISYDASNSDENIVLHEQKNKLLRPKIVIYFKKKLVIKPKQKGKISVEAYIKPCLCFVLKSETAEEKSSNGEFNLSMISTCKNIRDQKRFLVGKLFFNYS